MVRACDHSMLFLRYYYRQRTCTCLLVSCVNDVVAEQPPTKRTHAQDKHTTSESAWWIMLW